MAVPVGDALAGQGLTIGRYKARRLMRRAGLKPVCKRKFALTTDSKHNLPIAANILASNLIQARQTLPSPPTSPTSAPQPAGCIWPWCWTCFAQGGELAIAPSMPAELVCEALQMATGHRRPAIGLVVHSDRGSQYASHQYQALLTKHGFICSVSRRVNCWESGHCSDAVAERFLLNLKVE